ncbi:MAG: hypothetical protein Q4A75_07070, partial [Peptostreptococcaceae bacterium]|nr:hypothetical protein [Peptostreptococcaceae bacterium]
MKAMLMYLFPGLTRLDRKKQPSEKYIPILLLISWAAYFLMQLFWVKENYSFAALTALQKTGMLYFSYLILLELSPDTQNIRIPSIGILGIVLLLPVKYQMTFSTLFFLLNIRILTKSSGYLTTIGELIFMSIFTGILFVFSPFSYPFLFGMTLLLDHRYKHKDHRNIPFALVSLLISLLWIKNGFGIMTQELDPIPTIAVFVISLLYIFRLSILKNILSFNDTKTNLISPKRVKAAGMLLLISLMLLAIG